jgi:hypothetical protein
MERSSDQLQPFVSPLTAVRDGFRASSLDRAQATSAVRRLVRAAILMPFDWETIPGGDLLARPFLADVDAEAISGNLNIA